MYKVDYAPTQRRNTFVEFRIESGTVLARTSERYGQEYHSVYARETIGGNSQEWHTAAPVSYNLTGAESAASALEAVKAKYLDKGWKVK